MRGVNQAVPVAARNDLNAAIRNGGRIQRRPNRDQRVLTQVRPPILMPRQPGSFVSWLIHEHCSKSGNRGCGTVDSLAKFPENIALHELKKKRIKF